jgi:hypothetical protein
MHKRNTALIALVLAAVITAGVTKWHGSDTIGIIYFPAILLSVILSGRTREIGAVAEWSSFIVYTLFYLVIFLIVYVLLLELFLLRRGFGRFDNTQDLQPLEESSSQSTFESLGRAIHDVETKRRTHWLLNDIPSIDLSESPDVLGARAISGSAVDGPVKGLLKELKNRLVKRLGPAAAEAEMAKLKADAELRIANNSAAKTK